MAALVAVGVAASGERRVLGLELAAGNDEGSAWAAVIRRLVKRGLAGVRLVISDDHRGQVKAVREQLRRLGTKSPRTNDSSQLAGAPPPTSGTGATVRRSTGDRCAS